MPRSTAALASTDLLAGSRRTINGLLDLGRFLGVRAWAIGQLVFRWCMNCTAHRNTSNANLPILVPHGMKHIEDAARKLDWSDAMTHVAGDVIHVAGTKHLVLFADLKAGLALDDVAHLLVDVRMPLDHAVGGQLDI